MSESMQQRPTNAPYEPYLPTSGLAIASLVTGIIGFAGPIVFSAIALWTGYAARKETRARPPRATGDGMATAGIVMGWIQFGLVCVGALCFAAYMIFVLGLLGAASQ